MLGHRGASAIAPENTITAFLLARELGADGVELDVTLTLDRVPIVIHDDTVDRTTDGHGAARSMTLGEIKRLDAGKWKSEDFAGETIPTLAEVFEALASWLKPADDRPRGLVNVEIKSSGIRTDGVEQRVVEEIERQSIEEGVIISSFNPLSLARVRMLSPRLVRGLLYDPTLPVFLRRAWLRPLAAPQALHPYHGMIDAAYMDWARRKRYLVNTWTVDAPQNARRLRSLGVNAVITNQPDIIRQALS